jgi:hypothetical protein
MNGQDVIDVEETEAPARGGSRFNAVKHGLFAKTAVLPGEDAQAFEARVEMYKEGLQPRNGLQEDLALKAALASWQHDRAVAAEQSRVESELEAQEKVAAAEQLEALKLGSRLLFDRRGATEMYGSREYCSKQPKTSYSGDSHDPDQPERLVLQLEQTVAGCRWLLREWSEIRSILERGLGLQSREKLVISRLLGMQPINVAHKSKLAKIFIACHLIEPQYKSAFREMRCELDDPAYRHYNRCLSRRQIEALKPADETEARAYLLTVVDEATERLRAIEAELEKKAEENRARERCLIKHGVSKTGEQIRRSTGAFNRLLIQNVNTVRRVQREDDRGWEVVRKSREERRALRRNKTKRDTRMVMEPNGTVHDAEGYLGDVEAGVERFERKFGPQTNEATVERNMLKAVPDYARWKPPGAEQQQTSEIAGRGRRSNQAKEPDLAWAYEASREMAEMQRRAEARVEREIAAEQAEAEAREIEQQNEAMTSADELAKAVTVIVTGTGEQENVRNEIDGVGGSWVCDTGIGVDVVEQSEEAGTLEPGPASEGGELQIDGGEMELKADDEAEIGVERPTEFDPVILTESTERENVRNEIQCGQLASAEDDELLSEDELEASAEKMWASVGFKDERSFSFGRAEDAGTQETFDEILEEFKGLMPDIVRVLREDRKAL